MAAIRLAKNSYITSAKGAHLVDCLFDFSTTLQYDTIKTLRRGIAFQVFVKVLP
jgi:hypothetical protein